MKKTENGGMPFFRLLTAGIICFVAVYLSEITLGAVATIPFILILPGIAYLVYGNVLHLTGLCALAAFIFKFVFSDNYLEIILFAVFCSVIGFISVMTFRNFASKKRNAKTLTAFSVLFFISFIVYIVCYGTVLGNLSSKEMNRDYLEKTYPQEEFLMGSTYYSVKDGCYLTEFGFTALERYSALVSADKNGNAVIDGYRDRSRYDILYTGLAKIRTALSTFAYEGSDFVIRTDRMASPDIITKENTYSEYADKCCYEIALYYQFDNAESFETMCRGYVEHLRSYDSIEFGTVTFYGFDGSSGDDFAYVSVYCFDSDEFTTEAFDEDKYSRYFSEEDTHRYWKLLA